VTQCNNIDTNKIWFKYANPGDDSSIYSFLNEKELINDPGLITYLNTLEDGELSKESWCVKYDLIERIPYGVQTP